MLLGLDLGTTNIKAILAERDGRVVAAGSAPVKLLTLADGAVEQDIEDVLAATLSAIGKLGASASLCQVEAIGVSSQGGAMQLLDGRDRPVGRAISWLDGRGEPYNERIAREIGPAELSRRTGHARGRMALGQLLRLKQERPELLRPPHKIAFVGDMIVGRLCGRRAHDATSLSCAVLFNPTLRSADPRILERLGIREDQLPDLISAREAAGGGLREEIARSTSLPAGIPVCPAVHDQYASALGAGATAAGDVMFGAGTAWVLLAVADRIVEPAAGIGFVCTHLVDGLYGQILSLNNGGSAVTWALKLMGMGEEGGGRIDELLEAGGPGAEGLRFRPLLTLGGGAGLPPGASGRLTGLRLSHTRAHVLRAVVEGLAMELRRYLRLLTDAAVPVERLVMCGGAAQSRVTPRIVADATHLPVACVAQSATSALGAAMLARGLLEPKKSLADISRSMLPPLRLLHPGPAGGLYRTMFQEYLADLPRSG